MENKEKETSRMNKKGQLGKLVPSIIALVIAIIILVVGIVIVAEISQADIIDQAESSVFGNETITTVTETGETLSCGTKAAATCTLFGSANPISNQVNTTFIAAGNYTQTNCNIKFTGTANAINNSNWNVSYSCAFGGDTFISANKSLIGLGSFADFVPIIVIALAASIIIGLILLGFAGRGRAR